MQKYVKSPAADKGSRLGLEIKSVSLKDDVHPPGLKAWWALIEAKMCLTQS